MLGDERSREVFLGVMEYRRTGRLEPLLRTQDEVEDVMDQLLHFPSYRTAVDVGAYIGDTAQEMLARGPRLEKIWALEPDRRNFRKLCSFAEKEKRMERLLQTLTEAGRSPEFISRVDSEIARLSKECQDMKAEAKKIENKEGFSKIQISQVDLLISELKSFKEEFNSLSVPKKREYLKLLDKVVWDGEKAHIFLSGSH